MYMSDDKPIGWWVKHLDRALEHALDRALAGHGATRREWQLLNTAASGGPVTALAPFLDDPAEGDALVAGLVERGWVRADGDRLALTPAGAAARDRLAGAVAGQRRRAAAGIAPAEYATAVDVLRRMAGNLVAAP
jgi:hypothetical protein